MSVRLSVTSRYSVEIAEKIELVFDYKIMDLNIAMARRSSQMLSSEFDRRQFITLRPRSCTARQADAAPRRAGPSATPKPCIDWRQ